VARVRPLAAGLGRGAQPGRRLPAWTQCREPEVRLTIAAGRVANFGFKSGTGIIELLVSFDSEVRLGGCCKVGANFGIGTLAGTMLSPAGSDAYKHNLGEGNAV